MFTTTHGKKILTTSFSIEANYKTSYGEEISESFILDFSEFEGMSIASNSLHKISKNIEALQKDIHNLSTGFNKIKIISYTPAEIEAEWERAFGSDDDENEE